MVWPKASCCVSDEAHSILGYGCFQSGQPWFLRCAALDRWHRLWSQFVTKHSRLPIGKARLPRGTKTATEPGDLETLLYSVPGLLEASTVALEVQVRCNRLVWLFDGMGATGVP